MIFYLLLVVVVVLWVIAIERRAGRPMRLSKGKESDVLGMSHRVHPLRGCRSSAARELGKVVCRLFRLCEHFCLRLNCREPLWVWSVGLRFLYCVLQLS